MSEGYQKAECGTDARRRELEAAVACAMKKLDAAVADAGKEPGYEYVEIETGEGYDALARRPASKGESKTARIEKLRVIIGLLPPKIASYAQPEMSPRRRAQIIKKIALSLHDSISNWQAAERHAINFPEDVVGASPSEVRREAKALLNARKRERGGKPRKGAPVKPMSRHLEMTLSGEGGDDALLALIASPNLPRGRADSGEADLIVLTLCEAVRAVSSVKPAINVTRGGALGRFTKLLQDVGDVYGVSFLDRDRVTRLVKRWRKNESQIVF